LELTLELLSILECEERVRIQIQAIGMGPWRADPKDVLLIFKKWEKTTINVGLEMTVQDATLHTKVTRIWNTLE